MDPAYPMRGGCRLRKQRGMGEGISLPMQSTDILIKAKKRAEQLEILALLSKLKVVSGDGIRVGAT